MEIFNEQKLRAEIAKTWGEHGAHIEVYDMLLKKANVIKSVCECGEPVEKEYNDCCSYQCWKKKYD